MEKEFRKTQRAKTKSGPVDEEDDEGEELMEDSYGEEASGDEQSADDQMEDEPPKKKGGSKSTVYADYDEFAHLLEEDMDNPTNKASKAGLKELQNKYLPSSQLKRQDKRAASRELG
jgi:hypothetical protein